MSLDNFTNLKIEIQNYLDEDEYTSEVETWISLAESQHKLDVRIRDMIKRSQASASTSSRYLALPAGYAGPMLTVRLLSSPVHYVKYISTDQMSREIRSDSGKPEFFTVHEEIEFNRICDSAYTVEMVAFHDLTPLSAENTSNAILTKWPGLYLFGALKEAEPFIDNDERMPLWKAKYDELVAKVNMNYQRSQTSSVLQAVPQGAKP